MNRAMIERLRELATVKHAERLDNCCAMSLFSRQREPHREWEREAGICSCGAKEQNVALQLLVDATLVNTEDAECARKARNHGMGWVREDSVAIPWKVHPVKPQDGNEYLEVYVVPVRVLDREVTR